MIIFPLKNDKPHEQAGFEYDLEFEKNRIAYGFEEIKKSLKEKWQQDYSDSPVLPNNLLPLSPSLIDFLLSFQNTLFYNYLARKFGLTSAQRDMLPRIVWQICLKNDWEKLENYLQANLNVPGRVEIADALNQNILSKAHDLVKSNNTFSNKFEKEVSKERKTSLAIQDALKKHQELGDQLVTAARIIIKGFPETVRPTVKNWIYDYTSNTGYDRHTTFTRSSYLFQTANTRNLSDTDRQRLSFLLTAFDEKSPVTINESTKQIEFPAFAESRPEISKPPEAERKNPADLYFSSLKTTPDLKPPVPRFDQTNRPGATIPAEKTPAVKKWMDRPTLSSTPKTASVDSRIDSRRDISFPGRQMRENTRKASYQKSARPQNAVDLSARKTAFPFDKPASATVNKEVPAQANSPKNAFPPSSSPRPFAAKPAALNSNVRFSYSQKMPYEKKQEKPSVPGQSSQPTSPIQPLRISPVTEESPEEENQTYLPKNVVNLKED